jgi:hypothetical protein
MRERGPVRSLRALLVVLLTSVLSASAGDVAHGAVALTVETANKTVASVAESVAPSTDTILSEGRGSVLTCTVRPTAVDVEGTRSALATWLNVEGDPSALATWLNVEGDPSALATSLNVEGDPSASATWPAASAAKTLCAR